MPQCFVKKERPERPKESSPDRTGLELVLSLTFRLMSSTNVVPKEEWPLPLEGEGDDDATSKGENPLLKSS